MLRENCLVKTVFFIMLFFMEYFKVIIEHVEKVNFVEIRTQEKK